MYSEALQLLKNDHIWNDTDQLAQKAQEKATTNQQHSVGPKILQEEVYVMLLFF